MTASGAPAATTTNYDPYAYYASYGGYDYAAYYYQQQQQQQQQQMMMAQGQAQLSNPYAAYSAEPVAAVPTAQELKQSHKFRERMEIDPLELSSIAEVDVRREMEREQQLKDELERRKRSYEDMRAFGPSLPQDDDDDVRSPFFSPCPSPSLSPCMRCGTHRATLLL